MKVAIIEDEKPAAENLRYLLSEIDASIVVEVVLDSVVGAIEYFSQEHQDIELAFFDIHLADGISFEIFEKTKVNVPIVFTTAFNEYAIKAFKVNSVDYLLKPIDEEELSNAIQKFKSAKRQFQYPENFANLLQDLKRDIKQYKASFLVQQRDLLIPLPVAEIAYFTIDTGVVKAISFEEKSYVVEDKLEDIEAVLNPHLFFRVNRQFIVQRKAIKSMSIYFNGKLILNVVPQAAEQIVVSKVKAPQLKTWLDQ